jgi:predicted peptidase
MGIDMFEFIINASAVCRVFGDGQKVIAAVIEFSEEIPAERAAASDFAVTGRNVQKVYVSQTGKMGQEEPSGRYLVIELDPSDPEAAVRYRIGKGREARMGVKHPCLELTYLPTGERTETAATVDEVADKFRLIRYQVPGNEQYLDYQFFIPEEMAEGENYPLVLFMHDMGACSDDPLAPLVQGNGATIWAEAEEQRKRPCFVVAPCYTRQCADDDYEVTWEAEATADLIKELCSRYAVDRSRIYGTGQSMGCMMLCELNLRHPELFAGSYLVAGQWDPDRMGAAGSQNIWALVSEQDEKAFPIMGACMKGIERAGAAVVRGSIDAKAALEVQNAAFDQLAAEPSHVFFTWYEGNSVLPEESDRFPGACHVNTWIHAYSLESVRRWLFGCRK